MVAPTIGVQISAYVSACISEHDADDGPNTLCPDTPRTRPEPAPPCLPTPLGPKKALDENNNYNNMINKIRVLHMIYSSHVLPS